MCGPTGGATSGTTSGEVRRVRRGERHSERRVVWGLAHDTPVDGAPVCALGGGATCAAVCGAAQWCGSVWRAVWQRAACEVRRRAVDAVHEPVSGTYQADMHNCIRLI